MPKEENDAALQEPALKKKFQSVEICVFHQFDNSLLLVFFCFFFSFCVSCLEYKALVDASDFKNHEEIECYPRNSYTKSIKQKNLVKQNRLFGRPHCPAIRPDLQFGKCYRH